MAGKLLDPMANAADAPARFMQAVEAVRLEIVRAKDARADVFSRPVSLEIAQARLFAFCDRLQRDAMTRFGADRFISPDFREPSQADTQALLAAVLSDLVREEMTTRIADLYRPAPGLTDEDRDAQLSTIESRILDHECAEEALIRAAERAGFSVLRRANADPRAVLAFDEELA